jgi:hypothetical protein
MAATALNWHDTRSVFGFSVSCHFFDPVAANMQSDFVRRMLPVFQRGRPEVWVKDSDGRDFRAGSLIARPDAVLRHGAGLLCLEYKTQSGRSHTPERWHREIPTTGMLQCLAASIAVATETQRAVAPVLGCHNALYLLRPLPQVVDFLLSSAERAAAYWNPRDRLVAAARLARYCDPWLRETFRFNEAEDRAASEAGRRRHEVMLRGGPPGASD